MLFDASSCPVVRFSELSWCSLYCMTVLKCYDEWVDEG